MDTDAEYDPKFIDLQTYITYQLAPKWEINFLGNLANNNYKFTLIAGKPLSVQPSIPRTSKSISTEGKETVSKPYSVRLH